MAISANERKAIAAGVRLVATYKKQEHTAEVVPGEDGKVRFRLADGREFRSPSAAGSAVMGGVACNGWRFWSLTAREDGDAEAPDVVGKPAASPKRRTSRAKSTEPSAEDTAEPTA